MIRYFHHPESDEVFSLNDEKEEIDEYTQMACIEIDKDEYIRLVEYYDQMG